MLGQIVNNTKGEVMKNFLFLSFGFEQPTDEIMAAWGKWFESVGDKFVDMGAPLAAGREITSTGTSELTLDLAAITGYCVIKATDMDEAVKIAGPPITSNRIYEIMMADDHGTHPSGDQILSPEQWVQVH